jgi:CDP-diacylglycerol--glycerol-3-phosphate 3-phosphatidyltransferase
MGLVTVIGKFLDPLADKLMVMGMLVMLVALNRVPGWLVVLILAREMTINGLRSIASTEGMVIDGRAGRQVQDRAADARACSSCWCTYPTPSGSSGSTR